MGDTSRAFEFRAGEEEAGSPRRRSGRNGRDFFNEMSRLDDRQSIALRTTTPDGDISPEVVVGDVDVALFGFEDRLSDYTDTAQA